jgi:hypothetical protein
VIRIAPRWSETEKRKVEKSETKLKERSYGTKEENQVPIIDAHRGGGGERR